MAVVEPFQCPPDFLEAMSFDTLAPWYRTMEFISAGELLQRCRTRFLAETRSRRQALLLGEGPGRFLVELLRANPGVAVTCLERSPRMIEQAMGRLRRAGFDSSRVQFHECDALDWQPRGAGFDLVATHFFLDCFRRDQLEALVSNIARSTLPDACWLYSDFCVPPRGWRRWRAGAIIASMYLFFRLAAGLSATCLAPVDDLIEAAGFSSAGRHLSNFGLLRAELWMRGMR